jgi:hypothetical protein
MLRGFVVRFDLIKRSSTGVGYGTIEVTAGER